jgi:hypothetical protein
MERRSEIPNVDRRQDRKGRQQPATKPRKPNAAKPSRDDEKTARRVEDARTMGAIVTALGRATSQARKPEDARYFRDVERRAGELFDRLFGDTDLGESLDADAV